MLKNTIVVGQTKLDYFIHGQDPKLLLDSGTHGDEYDIIPLVENSVKKYLNQLPSFIYIPQISPSSVALKARNNKDNLNINRSYFTNSEVEEIKAVQKIIENYHFDL
ncbi:hypothetical protein HY030_04060 [Candidatus Gottesmanbacteria bacterium]|nr:hypothetical protein [Candidatus Gottesmanbacteria bacterium]